MVEKADVIVENFRPDVVHGMNVKNYVQAMNTA
jgi:hypothetical protein